MDGQSFLQAGLDPRLWRVEKLHSAAFIRWRARGLGKDGESIAKNADFGWLMIDGTRVKAHPHTAGAKGRKGIESHKSKTYPPVDLAKAGHGLSVRVW